MRRLGKNLPKKLEEKVKEIEKNNPDYDEAKVWATAWSVYCKHMNPESPHCKKDQDEYLKKKATREIVRRITARADVRPRRQRNQYNCTTTSLSMALEALGIPPEECSIDRVNRVLGAMPLRGAAWEQVAGAASHFGCRATLVVPSTLRQVRAWTDVGIPVIIGWNTGNEWSHASLIFDVTDDAVYIADPNIPNPDQTVRVMGHDEFYEKWWEKSPEGYKVRRPAMAIEREITPDGRQVMASSSYSGNPDKKPIYPQEIDHGYESPISGGSDVMKKLVQDLRKEQDLKVASVSAKDLASSMSEALGLDEDDQSLMYHKNHLLIAPKLFEDILRSPDLQRKILPLFKPGKTSGLRVASESLLKLRRFAAQDQVLNPELKRAVSIVGSLIQALDAGNSAECARLIHQMPSAHAAVIPGDVVAFAQQNINDLWRSMGNQ